MTKDYVILIILSFSLTIFVQLTYLYINELVERTKLQQTIKVFREIVKLFEGEDSPHTSFRKLIYNNLGFKPKDYCSLYCAGGQDITNIAYDRNDLIKTKIQLHCLVKKAYEEGKANPELEFLDSDSSKELTEIVENSWKFALSELKNSEEELKKLDD